MKMIIPRTEMKILYQDGNLDRDKPYTYSVELRRWDDSYCVDYVLLKSFTTDNNESVPQAIAKYYERIDKRCLLNVNSDGEAIRKAVDSFRELREQCEVK